MSFSGFFKDPKGSTSAGWHKIIGSGSTDDEHTKTAADKSATATEDARTVSEKYIGFTTEQQEAWKPIYGTQEEKIADYLNAYTGNDMVAQGLTENTKEFESAKEQLTTMLAQRGMSGSGLEAQGLTHLMMAKAEENARIRNSRESEVMSKRMDFLNLGMNKGTQLNNAVGNAYQAALGFNSNIAGQQTALQGQLLASNIAAKSAKETATIGAIGSVLGGFAQGASTPTPTGGINPGVAPALAPGNKETELY